jgi:hypothetical protein
VRFLFLFSFSNISFAAIMSHDSGKSIAEDDTKLAADPKVFMEAMMRDEACDERWRWSRFTNG